LGSKNGKNDVGETKYAQRHRKRAVKYRADLEKVSEIAEADQLRLCGQNPMLISVLKGSSFSWDLLREVPFPHG
jgi:hypoxanthine-guanine phosphoribosyltransferase